MNKSPQTRYEVTIYDGQTIVTRTMTREQVMEINPQSFDYFLSAAFGIWAFRTADGDWIEHRGADWPGLGDVCIKIIRAIQITRGEFQTPDDVVDLTGYHTLRNGNALSARLKAIREAHKDSFKSPHFFLSRRAGGFAIAWHHDKSWCWVERIRPATETNG